MLDPRTRNALAKAIGMGGAETVERERYGSYKVKSATRPGQWYTVSVDAQGRYRCTCEAGLAGNPCWHKAAVFIAKVEAQSKGRVTRPATTAEKGN